MAHETSEFRLPADEANPMGRAARPIYLTSFAVGIIGLVVAVLAAFYGGDNGTRHFGLAYLTSFGFFLSLTLGCLFFVLIQHLTRAGWSVVVRRVAEAFAASMPTMALLAIPILLIVCLYGGQLYNWAQPIDKMEHIAARNAAAHNQQAEADARQAMLTPEQLHEQREAARTKKIQKGERPDVTGSMAALIEAGPTAQSVEITPEFVHLMKWKRPYLNRWSFLMRWVTFLGVWSVIGIYFWRTSLRQDRTGDESLTLAMQKYSAPLMLVFAVTLTFGAFDLLMSLDARWYSTVFGVYFFAGCVVGSLAMMILVIMGLQRMGYMKSVTTEHYHDLGKLMFTFIFFWGYIAFAQYMLMWYGNIPDQVYWLSKRGMTTVPDQMAGNNWIWIALVLLFGHLLIPFGGLLSRHVKRNKKALAFWAAWMLVMHFIDIYWLVMPEWHYGHLPHGLVLFGCIVGVGGIFLGGAVRVAAKHSLVPTQDPRLAESLGFENM